MIQSIRKERKRLNSSHQLGSFCGYWSSIMRTRSACSHYECSIHCCTQNALRISVFKLVLSALLFDCQLNSNAQWRLIVLPAMHVRRSQYTVSSIVASVHWVPLHIGRGCRLDCDLGSWRKREADAAESGGCSLLSS